jgi:hypothetical protein
MDAPKPMLAANARSASSASKVGGRLIQIFWVALVLLWSPVKWLLSLDVLFQLLRAFWTQDPISVARVIVHFSVLCALSWFVQFYQPPNC